MNGYRRNIPQNTHMVYFFEVFHVSRYTRAVFTVVIIPMLVFSAILPHTKKSASIAKKALATLAQRLKSTAPDVLVIITPAGMRSEKGYAINLAGFYTANGVTYKGDPLMTTEIRKYRLEDTASPVMLVSSNVLDDATAVALSSLALTEHTPALIPIALSSEDCAGHVAFGDVIHDVLMSSSKACAVIAAIDISDEAFPSHLQNDELLATFVGDSDAHKALALLRGVMKGLPWTGEQLAYTPPALVAHLTIPA